MLGGFWEWCIFKFTFSFAIWEITEDGALDEIVGKTEPLSQEMDGT